MRRSGKNGERVEEVHGDGKRPARVEPLRPQAKGEMIREPIARIKERFGDILQNLSDLIWEVDENCVFTWCSGAAKDIFGVAAGELIGKRPFDFMPAEEAQRTKNIIEEMSLKKEPIKNLEAYHEDKRGRRHWLWVNAIPILDNKGTLKGYMGVCRDITSQKKAEESLRESELKFRTLANEAFDGIAIHDGQRIIEVNEAFGILWGYTPGEAAGLRNAKLFAPECWGTVKKNIQSGYDKLYETVAIRKDGTRFQVAIAAKSITYKGRTVRIAATRDITERKKAEKELRKFETISDKAGYGITILDLEGNVIYVNASFARMHGYTPGELTGKHISIFHTEQQMANVNRLIEQLNREGSYVSQEVWHKRNDNTEFPTLMTGTLVKDENGTPLFMAATTVDITDCKRAEEALQESEDKFKTLADEAFDSIVIHDGQRIIEVNKAFGRLWGYDPKEAVGMKIDKFFAPECWEDVKKRIQSGYDRPYEADTIRKDGTRFTVEIVGHSITYKGRPVRIATARDITERKRAEQALRASEERFRSLFEQAADAIVIIDARTGERAEFNDRAHQTLGYTRAEYAKLRLSDIEAIESKEEVAAHIDKIVRQGSDIFEAKQRKKDGTLRDILVSTKLITVAGKPYIQGIWRDITEIKKAERTLLEYQKQLKQLASQLALTEERERRRIAGELHDQLCQSLALAKIRLDAIRSSGKSKPAEEELMQVSDAMQRLIDQTRLLVFDLSSPILYELGFEAAVAEWLNEQVHDKGGIETEFQDDDQPKPLNDDVRVLLFRNVRELLLQQCT